ncbi:MAG: hypothetical protein NTY01_00600 [Verrucomicrobia bacterium]|nr:hypothetical protein [Verrucomicrobiota bacterium]
MNRDHLSGVLWTIASTVMFSLMTLFARLAHDVAGLDAWKTVRWCSSSSPSTSSAWRRRRF